MKNIIVLVTILLAFGCGKDEPVDCNTGFTGSSCNEQVTPSSILITSITLRSFPGTQGNGDGWDLADDADVYLQILFNEALIHETDVVENAKSSTSYNLTPPTSTMLSFDNPTDTYVLKLYDFDSADADDLMSSISIVPYSSFNGFPKTLRFGIDPTLVAEFGLAYNF